MVDSVIESLEAEMKKTEEELNWLLKQDKIIGVLRDEVKGLSGDLDTFIERYLA